MECTGKGFSVCYDTTGSSMRQLLLLFVMILLLRQFSAGEVRYGA